MPVDAEGRVDEDDAADSAEHARIRGTPAGTGRAAGGTAMTARRALVVRGGWDGHRPVEATDMFLPFLVDNGFDVRVEDSNEVYADREEMDRTDLIVQSVTMSDISDEALKGLRGAVERGTGLAGWHGGIADSYRNSSDYLQLIGGQFATHPGKHPDEREGGEADNFLCYTVDLTELGRRHPVMEGIEDFTLRTEQYWVLTDDLNDVLATTTHPVQPFHPWHRPITSPAVWTREWGRGRVFVATPGHSLVVLRDTSVRTIIERGMLWASRTVSE
jgi:type 1 glutamine amidotransferase